MAYTAQQLITFSFNLSNIISVGLQTISNDQLNQGLDRLNGLLASLTANMQLVPFWQQYNFSAITGQETYPIPGLIQIETLTFTLDTIRYSMRCLSREEYFGTSRANNIESLPNTYHMERYNGGANVSLYFLPDQQNYEMELWGKFMLTNVLANTDLTLPFEAFFIEYLKYSLASYICELYNVTFPPEHAARLRSYEQSIKNVSPLSLTMKKVSAFTNVSAFNYGDVNIGKAWRPM